MSDGYVDGQTARRVNEEQMYEGMCGFRMDG